MMNEIKSEGVHYVIFDATKLPGGLYFCRIQAEANTEIFKMISTK